jgi:hypothetical protein
MDTLVSRLGARPGPKIERACSWADGKTKPRRPSSWQRLNHGNTLLSTSTYFFLVVFFAFFAGAFFVAMDSSPPFKKTE